jgi:hypothetical protein
LHVKRAAPPFGTARFSSQYNSAFVFRGNVFEADRFAFGRNAGDRAAVDSVPLFCVLGEIHTLVASQRCRTIDSGCDAECTVRTADRDLIQRRRSVIRDEVKLSDIAECRAVYFRVDVLFAVGRAAATSDLPLS